MNRKKIFLYTASAAVWLFIVFCTISQDQSNYHGWSDFEAAPKQVALNDQAAILYGPLASGDTHVSLKYNDTQIETVITETTAETICHSVFPAGTKHLGVAFKQENDLDTLVLFNASEAFVFNHVLAMDSKSQCIANLALNDHSGIDLIVSTFEKITITKITLPNHTPDFLLSPTIESAAFIGSEFKIDTAFGSYRIPIPSLI